MAGTTLKRPPGHNQRGPGVRGHGIRFEGHPTWVAPVGVLDAAGPGQRSDATLPATQVKPHRPGEKQRGAEEETSPTLRKLAWAVATPQRRQAIGWRRGSPNAFATPG
jgi:hypothetical protein